MRRYQALLVRCPACGANPERPCVGWDAKPMRGVHRRRDEAFNKKQKLSESPEPTVGAQARGSRMTTTTRKGPPLA